MSKLELQVGFPLPEAYRQYLLWMGNDRKGIFVGCNWFIGDVISNTAYLPELLTENGVTFEMPTRYLAFFGHQGYMSAWFVLPKVNEDPPCYFFKEGNFRVTGTADTVPVIAGAFTEVLSKDMKHLASCVYGDQMLKQGYLPGVRGPDELKQKRRWWQFWS